MSSIETFKQKRANCKAQVTRIQNFLEKNPETTASEAKVRLKKLDEYLNNFQCLHEQIREIKQPDEDDAENFYVDCEKELEAFEEKYFAAAAAAQECIDRIEQGIQYRPAATTPSVMHQEMHYKAKLPDIKLLEFDGEYTKWMVFKNSFETTIDSDPDIPAMQKHQYLIGVLQEEARKVIEGFTISNENYANAWKLLKDTYDNKMMIIENHLEELFKFPNINKDDKAESMRKMIWHIQTHVSALGTLQQPVSHWDTLIIHLSKKQLDYVEQRDWQNLIRERNETNMPKLVDFIKFLNDRCHTLRMLSQNNPKLQTAKQAQNVEKKSNKRYEKSVSLVTTSYSCNFCAGGHTINRCEKFLKLTVDERKQAVIKNKLCLNCLRAGHFAQNCKSSSCIKCNRRHNTLLHKDEINNAGLNDKTVPTDFSQDGSPVNLLCIPKVESSVMLSTAQVHVQDREGNQVVCRALLDPGSQTNIITTELTKILKLPLINECRHISGINQSTTNTNKVVQVQIRSLNSDFVTSLECVALPKITGRIPQIELDVKKLIIPNNLSLADPVFNKPGQIDMLIGAGLYWKILVGSPRNEVYGQPAMQNTRLGWILGGEICQKKEVVNTCLAITNDQLQQQLERFWKQEAFAKINAYTKEEVMCEKHFSETVQRNSEGRFIVRLPIRPEVALGESRKTAYHRLISLERRLHRNSKLRDSYCEFLEEYLTRKDMTLIDETEIVKLKETYFIPHQAIIRPDSVTTKLRVVFDASTPTSLTTSLNDKLMTGPNLQRDLLRIILRFRTHEFVMTADIEKMFRQILVHPDDRSLQLILWNWGTEENPRVYQLNTVTYGTVCAPYIAMRCLRELASLYRQEFPLAAKVIDEDFYMDDVLTGERSLHGAIQLQKQLSELLNKGQFPLRKWRSNDRRILKDLNEQSTADNLFTIEKAEALKTLGLLWNSEKDILQYKVELSKGTVLTKRTILSKISQIFDPLGLVAPVLIKGKMFMQALWSKEIDWDQPLAEDELDIWENYYSSLTQINDIQIARNINPGNHANKFDLFGFGDASERAFGACLYAVSVDNQGVEHSHLLCAKSKVAPLKTISLPRLELEAARMLSQLLQSTEAAFQDKINQVRLWSDSTIVLGWIKSEPYLLKTFVANRVTEIQELTAHAIWQHVPSEESPADMLSRGITADNLINCDLWWYGPSWLRKVERCPANIEAPETNLPELKTTLATMAAFNTSDILQKYSSYYKLTRIIAYCHRFRAAFTKEKKRGCLTPGELDKAESTIARWIQQERFPLELNCLKNNRILPRKSPLRSLSPILDTEGVIRVGGRLQNANLAEEQKHPIILPSKNNIITTILSEEHIRLKHCPSEQLLHSIRQKFWPLSGRREAQKTVKRCLKCFRFKPTSPDVLMGSLPKERVVGFTRAFLVTGVDYAGPLQVRESRRRGKIHISKAYVAVFTCFSTKAIHLELVTELTTESFLAALSRFTARRGICAEMFSDNGTNLVGAARKLEEIFKFLREAEPDISTFLARQRIKWSFIPPRSPHFGGLWEAAVKSMKRQLYTVTQGKAFTFEETYTILTEIEAVLNSRPMTPLTTDPNDFQVLTPSHFLINDSLIQPVQHNFLDVSDNRLSRWQHMQKIRQQLWQRWHREYLQELQKRTKWNTPGESIKLNRLVLLMEDHVAPLHWPIGRITELHPGRDGEVRVVTVATPRGTYKRAVKKICLLPLTEEDQI